MRPLIACLVAILALSCSESGPGGGGADSGGADAGDGGQGAAGGEAGAAAGGDVGGDGGSGEVGGAGEGEGEGEGEAGEGEAAEGEGEAGEGEGEAGEGEGEGEGEAGEGEGEGEAGEGEGEGEGAEGEGEGEGEDPGERMACVNNACGNGCNWIRTCDEQRGPDMCPEVCRPLCECPLGWGITDEGDCERCQGAPDAECQRACDCRQGLMCAEGRCIAGFAPVWCCDKPGCGGGEGGEACRDSQGDPGVCLGDGDPEPGACRQDADCQPAFSNCGCDYECIPPGGVPSRCPGRACPAVVLPEPLCECGVDGCEPKTCDANHRCPAGARCDGGTCRKALEE